MSDGARRYGRRWVVILLVIILVLPLGSLFFLKKGFQFRERTPASEQLLPQGVKFPDYRFVSQRGDTITRSRMLNKVCVFNFVAHSCVPQIDAGERRLFELQEDYYEKTTEFRILSPTLQPGKDDFHQLNLMGERYAAREMWHFLRSEDSTASILRQFCLRQFNTDAGNDSFCPGVVYLVDGNGMLRGVYDQLDKQQFNNLYNDILYLINQIDVQEEN